jgi:pimeloyl-ACP methyl ester carboxylesterase
MHLGVGDMPEVTHPSYAGVRTRQLTVEGSGPTVLLLHGFADNALGWRTVLRLLAAGGRSALAVDLPGFGTTEPRRPGLVLPPLEQFVAALVDAHTGPTGPPVLVGNSLGALLSIRAAARQLPAVAGVIALDEPALGYSRTHKFMSREDEGRLLGALLRPRHIPVKISRTTALRVLRRVAYADPHRVDPTHLEGIVDYALSNGTPDVALREVRSIAREVIDPYDFAAITCPLLVVHGARDRIIPVAASRRLHEAVPGSEFVVLPNCGHCPQVEQPAEVVGLIERFVTTTLRTGADQ